jgi:prepilin-type processing-associated H-X9-DG protein
MFTSLVHHNLWCCRIMMVPMRRRTNLLGLTLIETAISIALISVLLAILLPALSSARTHSFRENCHDNQRRIGEAWQMYLRDNNDRFPTVAVQPGWFYGGVRFSVVNENPFPDNSRPLTVYLPTFRSNQTRDIIWCCPGDHGISDPNVGVVSGRRTTFRSYGNSYRANAALLYSMPPESRETTHSMHDGDVVHAHPPEPRGLRRNEITTAPSRLVIGGDAAWYEAAESTGRSADWHGVRNGGNLLFLDGSVRFVAVKPKGIVGPVVFDPIMSGSAYIQHELPSHRDDAPTDR